ncbi:Peptidoglycan/LPS O-acetylase OafA/YrhL, contains acyltransferase and SGNH-hydrolase domains [Nocardioides sp. YR527]|uniref:acyltransferase family protein n=1 Tax=Nocardioides sp. YR527 TaxID=1881028 RepID=UPI0008859B4F|nr:acyltransferase family protein [Nocardioides sp. YR527]SDJ88342.1 Peptidoglycan/LPS O-acetylase OafA/YrhL, contains acyltransferase and SGNH-hydrolase domains [Nocardioides sp. YR527]
MSHDLQVPHLNPSTTVSNQPTSRPAKRLRGDVQGLRAVAILTVLAAHAGVSWFAGGFVGVDVFFVISGFLITQQLVGELGRTGRISLRRFYARRARRILPAATLTLAVTVVAAVALLGPAQVATLATDAVWASAFAANIRMAIAGTDYFQAELPPSPVQHFWSLAVEEQFYLVWPLVALVCIVLAARIGRARGGERAAEQGSVRARRFLLAAIALITVSSLVWSILHTPAEATSAYFSSLTRAWELGVGAALAILVTSGRVMQRIAAVPIAREVLALGGLAAIIVACLAYDESTPFPGYHAALPVLGSAAVILAGALPSGETTIGARLLSVAPMRAIGDWSFSLYLWHWPLLVLPEIVLQRELTWPERGLAVAGAFVLAYVSFRIVEAPFREGALWRPTRRALTFYPVSIALVAAIAFGGTVYADFEATRGSFQPAITLADAPAADPSLDKQEALVRASVLAAREDTAVPTELRPALTELDSLKPSRTRCDYTDDTERDLCVDGDPDGDRTMVVFGNSHALHWVPTLNRVAKEHGFRAYFLVKNRCVSASITTDRGSDEHDPYTECDDFNRWAFKQYKRLDPDLTVVSTAPPIKGVFDEDGDWVGKQDRIDELMHPAYTDFLRRVDKHARRTVLIRDIQGFDANAGTCLSRPGATLGDCLMGAVESRERSIDVQVRAAEEVGVDVADMSSYFCWDGSCPAVVGDTITHYDGTHMSRQYAPQLTEPLARELGIRGRG